MSVTANLAMISCTILSKYNYNAMTQNKQIKGVNLPGYASPEIEVLSISLESAVLSASSTSSWSGNGPEGYDIDNEVFKW